MIRRPSSLLTGGIIKNCVGGFSTWEKLREVKAFFEGKDTQVSFDILCRVLPSRQANENKKFDKTLEQAFDEIRGKAEWVERDREDVADWLKAHGYYENTS